MSAIYSLLLVVAAALHCSVGVVALTRVSCIGDSITAGACAQKTKGYPAVLQSILGSSFQVTNFGNSGKTMLTDGLCGPPPAGNCSYVGTPTWPAALASQPDIVTIMLGTNDAKEFNWFGIQDNTSDSYVLDYMRMIKTVKALPSNPKIFLLTLVPLYTPYPYAMNATVINNIVSAVPGGIVAQIASIADVGLIDVHAAFDSYGPNITCDGCHPTDDGYELIAQTLAPVIRQAAAERGAGLPPHMPLDKVQAEYGSEEYAVRTRAVNRFVGLRDQ